MPTSKRETVCLWRPACVSDSIFRSVNKPRTFPRFVDRVTEMTPRPAPSAEEKSQGWGQVMSRPEKFRLRALRGGDWLFFEFLGLGLFFFGPIEDLLNGLN